MKKLLELGGFAAFLFVVCCAEWIADLFMKII